MVGAAVWLTWALVVELAIPVWFVVVEPVEAVLEDDVVNLVLVEVVAALVDVVICVICVESETTLVSAALAALVASASVALPQMKFSKHAC